MKKEIVFLFLCVALLGFLIYRTLREGRWSLEGTAASRQGESLPLAEAIQGAQIARIELRRAQDIIVFTHPRGMSWKMVNPVSSRPDPEKLKVLFDLLLEKDDPKKLRIPMGKETALQEAALNAFGMGKPTLGVLFEGTFGQQTFWVGDKAPQEQGYYARWTQGKSIELIPAVLYEILVAPVDALRERRIFYDGAAPITEVLFRKKAQALQLLADGRAIFRAGEGGSGDGQIIHRADPAARQEVLDFLDQVRCKAFGGAKGQALSSEPLLKIRLTRKTSALPASEESWVLEKVCTAQTETYVLQGATGQGQERFIVDPTTFSRYLGDLSWILDRRWTPLQPEQCRFLALTPATAGAKALEFVNAGGVWTASTPEAWRVDQHKVQSFLRDFLAVRVNRFLACREMPAQGGTQIRLGGDAKDAMQINAKENVGHWTVHRQGDSFMFDAPMPGWDLGSCADGFFWRDKTVMDCHPAAVQAITLDAAKSRTVFFRQGEKWRLSEPHSGEANETLEKALGGLLPLHAVRFLSSQESAEMEKKAGKMRRRLKVLLRVSGPEGNKDSEIWIGKSVPGGILAKLASDPAMFVVPSEAVVSWLRDPITFVSVLEEDSNHDGKIDQWVHYRDGKRSWMESDSDGDGRVDTKTFWRYNGRGDLIRMDTDTNNDGVIDQRTYFVDGLPYRQEDDTRGTGHVDLWTTFVRGVQARQRLDSDNNGKPDLFKRLQRDANGEIVGAKVHFPAHPSGDYFERYDKGKILREQPQR